MGSRTLTISLREDVEKKLREMAVQKYGRRKGFISKFVTDAVEEISFRRSLLGPDAFILDVLKRGIKTGGLIKYKSRDELYER